MLLELIKKAESRFIMDEIRAEDHFRGTMQGKILENPASEYVK